jgi:hypothetical protein
MVVENKIVFPEVILVYVHDKLERINCRYWLIFLFISCFFTIYSKYLKRVINKRDGCVYMYVKW